MEKVLKMPKGIENHIDIGKIGNLVSTDSFNLAYSFIRYSDIYVSKIFFLWFKVLDQFSDYSILQLDSLPTNILVGVNRPDILLLDA